MNVADAKHFLESFDNHNNLFSPDDFTDKTYIKGLKLGDPINITTASKSCTYSKAATVNEQSFDIVTIEPMLKSTNHGTIHCTRIGAGYDRTFTY